MYFKVKITKGLPQAKSGGFTGNNLNKQVISFGGADMNASSKHLENTRYLKQVPRDEANLEAEKGESAFGDINGDGFPEHMLIGGKRHTNGGTPLNLPDGTFIFSDTASMKITDCKILKMFGKACGKKGYTPAELAKPYDLNKYRKILEDPNSDKVDKKSAELMIKNINMKLGALALAQEAKKGFPQGIPEVARPYMEQMGIKEEDLVPQKAQPEAQVNNQAMNNPYENQGMGEQSPEEESMEAPMGRYGFQMGRRLRVAQEGMEQGQPSPEEMAMMQQQQGAPQQQGGGNPLAQMVQQVQQMLQQGAQPEDVVMQLLQNQVPPQAIMQILVEVGMPQEEAQATIEEVMQQGQQNPQEEMAEGPQGQNPQEEMMETPMAQYGTTMGGFNPMEQFGSENNSENNQSTSGGGFFSNLFGGNNKRRIKNKKNVINNNYYGYPQSGAASNQNNDYMQARPQSQNNYYNTYGSATPSTPEIPTNQGENNFVNASLKTNQSAPFTPSFKGETPRFSQGSIGTDGYTPPSGYRDGGALTRYQTKGEVTYKIYNKDKLPAGAVARDRITTDTQIGDYVKQEDGSYKKVTAYTLGKDATADTRSLGITIDEFKKASPENEKLIEDANAIIEKGIDAGTIIEEPKKSGKIKITGNWNGDLRDRILLSRVVNATNTAGKLGTDKYKIVSQGATGPYSKTVSGKIKGSGSFVAGFTPDLYEQRFIFEQAKGLGMSDDDAFAEVDRIQKDPKAKALARRQFANTLKLKDIPKDDAELLSENFYKKNYSDVTKGIEGLVSVSGYRPAMGNDVLGGIEHFDALGFKPDFQYEQDVPAKITDAEAAAIADEENPEQYPPTPEASPWLQDRLNRLNAGIDYVSNRKYRPFAPFYHPETMTPTYYNPDKELGSNAGLAYTTNNALGAFTGGQNLLAGSSGVSAQFAKNAADILGKYNNLNVGIANQFEGNNKQIRNEAQRYNNGLRRELYDLNTSVNERGDQKKAAARKNFGLAQNALITNMYTADAMNQMTPQYAIDTSVGGKMNFTHGKRYKPTTSQDALEFAQSISNSRLPEKVQYALIMDKLNPKNGSGNDTDLDYALSAYNAQNSQNMPMKKGGAAKMGYVMGSNVFPFMFT
jgi:hypothetical protein